MGEVNLAAACAHMAGLCFVCVSPYVARTCVCSPPCTLHASASLSPSKILL